jgi:hypothetical protein
MNKTDTVPVNSGSQSQLSTEQRVSLELACVDVICQLESLLSQANEYNSTGRLQDVVAVANRMLLSTLDFGETYCEGDSLSNVQDRISEAYTEIQVYSDAIHTRSWSAFRRVIGKTSASEIDVLHAHSQVGDAVAVAIVTSLGGGIRRLGIRTSMGSQLAQSLELFVAEMKKGW